MVAVDLTDLANAEAPRYVPGNTLPERHVTAQAHINVHTHTHKHRERLETVRGSTIILQKNIPEFNNRIQRMDHLN